MKVRFVYARFRRHAESHPELLEHVPCNEYFGPPSLGIAYLAAVTPPEWQLDFRDDRLEDIGLDDDDVDLFAISCFTPSAVRAMEIADQIRARGKKVVMGGIFPTMRPDEVAEHADAVVIGEGEVAFRKVLDDFRAGKLLRRYEAVEPADYDALPTPRLDLYMEKEGRAFAPDDYPVQLSRGCPLKCSACVLPTSMGRALRPIPVEHVLRTIDLLESRGKLASLTEDTSFFPGRGARGHFGALLDALAERGGKPSISYVGISMPMILATPDSFFERLHRAGITMFYLVGGFDPITMGAFTGRDAKAHQRGLDAVKKCFDHGIEPYTSFLVGNDDDDLGTFDRMLEFANASGIRKAEFAVRTPYPGTPTWYELESQGRILHRDWSRYNDAHVVFEPAQMTPEQLQEGYLYLWRELYRSRRSLAEADLRERTIQF